MYQAHAKVGGFVCVSSTPQGEDVFGGNHTTKVGGLFVFQAHMKVAGFVCVSSTHISRGFVCVSSTHKGMGVCLCIKHKQR